MYRYIQVWTAVTGIAALFGGVLWMITTAPALVAFLVVIAIAVCWCVWLERHPEGNG
jgi:hypothetical protein